MLPGGWKPSVIYIQEARSADTLPGVDVAEVKEVREKGNESSDSCSADSVVGGWIRSGTDDIKDEYFLSHWRFYGIVANVENISIQCLPTTVVVSCFRWEELFVWR